ncbi:winged helix-turn-helix transcriptional regulator [Paenibacillus sanguinis]|uniref:winged helix-turn-helix transcriptional regulator n=1 Tax=Paenibacillus sanguinis TaxID=225906 RepID=UPI00035DD605|nr:helix-turn-helix domain-containing protein [Paenibacillus sanguinis]
MNTSSMCPRFEKAVELLSKRWTTFIVYKLLDGPKRFIEIENSLSNLSGKMLSERLKELEEEGVIQRIVYPEKPVRIEYSLTSRGMALAPVFAEIQDWATEWIELAPPPSC